MGSLLPELTAAVAAVQQLGELVKCSICCESTTGPTRLPCNHFFCGACITRHINVRGKKAKCPNCNIKVDRRMANPDHLLASILPIIAAMSDKVEPELAAAIARMSLPIPAARLPLPLPITLEGAAGPDLACAKASAALQLALPCASATAVPGVASSGAGASVDAHLASIQAHHKDFTNSGGSGGKRSGQLLTAAAMVLTSTATAAGMPSAAQGSAALQTVTTAPCSKRRKLSSHGTGKQQENANSASDCQEEQFQAAVAAEPRKGGGRLHHIEQQATDHKPSMLPIRRSLGLARPGTSRAAAAAADIVLKTAAEKATGSNSSPTTVAIAAAGPTSDVCSPAAGASMMADTKVSASANADINAKTAGAGATPVAMKTAAAASKRNCTESNTSVAASAGVAARPFPAATPAPSVAAVRAKEATPTAGLLTPGEREAGISVGDGAATARTSHSGPPSSSRRVPSRLRPWPCQACTFENMAGALKCKMCKTLRIVSPQGCGVNAKQQTVCDPAAGSPTATDASEGSIKGCAIQRRNPAAGTSTVHMPMRQAAEMALTVSKATAAAPAAKKNNAALKPPKASSNAVSCKRMAPLDAGAEAVGPQNEKAAGGPGTLANSKRQKQGNKAAAIPAEFEDAGLSGSHASHAAATTGSSASVWANCSGWVLLCTNLSDPDKRALVKLVRLAGCRLVENWCVGVTHVLCPVAAQQPGRTRRTLKYLLGVVHGAWVLDATWINACISQGRPLPEVDYQMQGDTAGGKGGPAAGRLRHTSGGSQLLAGWSILLAGSFEGNKHAEVGQIARAAGATLISRLPTVHHSYSSKDPTAPQVLVLIDPATGPHAGSAVVATAKGAGLAVAPYSWLWDSVGQYKVQPLPE